jgi:hypothetical protein
MSQKINSERLRLFFGRNVFEDLLAATGISAPELVTQAAIVLVGALSENPDQEVRMLEALREEGVLDQPEILSRLAWCYYDLNSEDKLEECIALLEQTSPDRAREWGKSTSEPPRYDPVRQQIAGQLFLMASSYRRNGQEAFASRYSELALKVCFNGGIPFLSNGQRPVGDEPHRRPSGDFLSDACKPPRSSLHPTVCDKSYDADRLFFEGYPAKDDSKDSRDFQLAMFKAGFLTNPASVASGHSDEKLLRVRNAYLRALSVFPGCRKVWRELMDVARRLRDRPLMMLCLVSEWRQVDADGVRALVKAIGCVLGEVSDSDHETGGLVRAVFGSLCRAIGRVDARLIADMMHESGKNADLFQILWENLVVSEPGLLLQVLRESRGNPDLCARFYERRGSLPECMVLDTHPESTSAVLRMFGNAYDAAKRKGDADRVLDEFAGFCELLYNRDASLLVHVLCFIRKDSPLYPRLRGLALERLGVGMFFREGMEGSVKMIRKILEDLTGKRNPDYAFAVSLGEGALKFWGTGFIEDILLRAREGLKPEESGGIA